MENGKPFCKQYLIIFLLLLGLSSSLSANTNPLLSPSDSILEVQRQRFLPHIHSVAWVRDLIAEDSTSSRAKILKPLAALDENWLKQARFSPQMPQQWVGFWSSSSGDAVDVFPRNVFYKGRLYRVRGAFELQGLLIFQIEEAALTKLLAMVRTSSRMGESNCHAFELSKEKFTEPTFYYLSQRERRAVQMIPNPLYGEYVEQNTSSFMRPKTLAALGQNSVVAMKRRWLIKSRGEVFMKGRRAYRLFTVEEKSGLPGYFLLEKMDLYKDVWTLSLIVPSNHNTFRESFFVLGTKTAKPDKIRIPYTWIVFTALFALLVYVLYRRRLYNLQRAQSRTQLALSGLRAQLNPHFLFNALTSIQDLVNQDNKPAANRYFNEMAELLRYVVDSSKEEYTPLAAELEALEKYCSLESLRTPFGYSFDVRPELNQNTTEIPTLLIQPFIENAILHGLRPSTEAKELKVSIWPEGDNRIGVSILDNGIGIEEAQRRQNANNDLRGHQGMATTQQRIDLLNEGKREKITLKVIDRRRLKSNLTGTLVQLSIPI
ncbi:sensor histidine kinase [Haliscomenobacter hydrossis]|uniref:Signal transduction histidine kinase n=1 Tax=Haliscomenobacter hydrossis (strain ATCC 27775 / DSM 1100 / LMG 10767 / O) TaxID=760192 RepID=F4L810_HALH1|nr:histidine kinase [Haliscomenobacter hydrossis]AEE54518.1 putative signal transduction histidine kinase [Haliscomenobacter hydrossis DSM 1100]